MKQIFKTLDFSSISITLIMMFFFFENNMPEWENFEIKCSEYLNRTFANQYNCSFVKTGGHNANIPDISVMRDGSLLFSIEVKMAQAQCGQFVLTPDNSNKKFLFSRNNRCRKNDHVNAIISAMESNYDLCIDTLDNLPIPQRLIYNWVKDYYLNQKKSRYFITHDGNEYILIPVERLEVYFDFSAKFRPKTSGSSNPSKNNITEITSTLDNNNIAHGDIFIGKDRKAIIELDHYIDSFKLTGHRYRYQFKNIGGDGYRITRLANTCNSNFIVAISLKNRQLHEDMTSFISALQPMTD